MRMPLMSLTTSAFVLSLKHECSSSWSALSNATAIRSPASSPTARPPTPRLIRRTGRPGAGPELAPTLTLQEDLDRMPARRDVRLAAALVGFDDDVRRDLRVALRVVDDAGLRVADDVVDVGLVHRPRVDLALGAGLRIVDAAAGEATRLGDEGVVARGDRRA